MAYDTILTKTGANGMLASGVNGIVNFRVSVLTPDAVWGDTVLTTTVTIGVAMFKAIDSILTDTTNSSVKVITKLSVSEANGNLLNGHSLEDASGTPIMFIKSKHPNNSKSATDLFKYTTNIRLRNIS